MRLLFNLSLFLFIGITIQAQEGDILLTNSKKISEDRYEGVKGTPYAFKEWHPATIISTEAEVTEVAAINYNAYTQNLEVQKGKQFIELDPAWYVRVIIQVSDTEAITFQRAFQTELQSDFMQLVYDGDQVQVYKQSRKDISTKVINDVGKTREAKKFVNLTKYQLIENDKAKSFKLSKKDFLKKIGNKKAAEGLLKKNKLKLNKEADLVKLMELYDML